MQLTALQKSTAQAIVNIFETGSIRGNYGDVTLLPGDSGQLTYGRSQTTLASGNLYLLIQDYCARNDGALSSSFKPYLPQLEACDVALNTNLPFRELLKDAGDDPVMQEVQDAFFDRVYWDPAMRSADAIGAQTALGAAIVYDSTVHGSWAHVRDLTRQQFGDLKTIGEQQWMSDYVDTRREWLATYPNPLLHKTVYRMDAFRVILSAGNWKLALPLVVRGLSITPDALAATVAVNVPAEGTPRRLLSLKSPPMTGPDVSWLQQRLSQAGIKVAASGTFDAATDAAVRAFQGANDLKVDGVVGPVTRAALEDVPVLAPKTATTALASEPMPSVPMPKAAPAAPAAPAAAPAAPPAAKPAAPGADATAELKSHVTSEVKAGVATIQKSIADSQKQLATLVVPQAAKAPAGPAARLAGATITGLRIKGRPGIAAGISALTLAFTEGRDAIAWVAAGPWTSGGKPVIALPPLPSLPKTISDVEHFVAGAYAYLQGLAAMLPNEWLFRLRVFAFALLCYALYRLIAGRVDVQKVEGEVQQAQGAVREGEQIAQGVEQVAETIKSAEH